MADSNPLSGLSIEAATSSKRGTVKPGTNLTVAVDGTLNASTGTTYTLPNATSSVLGGVKVGSGLSITGGTLSANAATPLVETDFTIRLYASLGGSGAEYTFTRIFARYYRLGARLFFEFGFTVDAPRPDRPGDFGVEMQHGYTSLDPSDLGSIQMDYYNNLGETVYDINPFLFDNNILFAVKKDISNTSYNPRLLATSITSGTSIRVSGNFLSTPV